MNTVFSLAAGLLGIVANAAATPSGRVEVVIELASPASPSRSVAVSVVARPGPGSSPSAGEVRHQLDLLPPAHAGRVELELPPGTWGVAVRTPGWWSKEVVVAVHADARERVDLRVWPTARVSAPVSFAVKEGKPPGVVFVRFRRTPEREGQKPDPEGTVRCPVEDQRAVCELPATRLDLRFEAPGLIPIYQWVRELKAGGQADLGTLRFEAGSSVVGYVRDRKQAAAVQARVQLVAAADGEPIRKADRSDVDARVNERGFFQLRGLSPGSYQLVATDVHGCSGATEVTVGEAAETRLRQHLEMDQPVTVSVSVEPPKPPDAGRWKLVLIRFPGGEQRLDRATNDTGQARFHPVSPGEYSLELWSGSQRWAAEDFVVEGTPGPVVLKVSPLKVTGTVRLGREALAAQVTFGFLGERAQMTFEADAEGRFEGMLPRGGKWNVQVDASAPLVNRKLRGVEVTPGSAGEARVDLTLADTHLKGRVVSDEGQGQRALLKLQPPADSGDNSVQLWSGNDGSFEFHGLPAGTVALFASAGAKRSDVVQVILAENETREVTLTVVDAREVGGLVLSAQGAPVAGVRIAAWPANRIRLGIPAATSDAEGRFTLRVPPGTTEVELAYAADPGLRLTRLALPADPQQELTLSFTGGSGTLSVELPAGFDMEASRQPFAMLVHEGADAPVLLLRNLARAKQTTTDEGDGAAALQLIPLLAMGEGDYQLCLMEPAVLSNNPDVVVPPPPCTGGRLLAGGELTLRLPSLSAESRN